MSNKTTEFLKVIIFLLALVSACLALFGCSANRIILVGPSHHFNAGDKTYNNDNYGFGLESDEAGFIMYPNSIGNNTLAVYHKFRTTDYIHFFLGGATGYNDIVSLFGATVFTFGSIRVLSSFPVGALMGQADVINLQYAFTF